MRCAVLVASVALAHGAGCPMTIREMEGSYVVSQDELGPLGTATLADDTLSIKLEMDGTSLGTMDGPWVAHPELPCFLKPLRPGPRLTDGPFPPSQGELRWRDLQLWPRRGHGRRRVPG